ncbi:hypothetical protein LWI29_006237 [Acer saccharum]|uniref:Uncharacterized protein n=1 Tax=Acer saccharum TaxID=4024 RepID=A0AA39RXG1_ACESA|nr:hypothetical protein LWI29_006237 [Acer saccharum]
MVSYGRQGSKNVKGRYGRNGIGSSGVAEKSGNIGKVLGNSSGKRADGGLEQGKSGKSPQINSDISSNHPSKHIPTAHSNPSGSRFDILRDDFDVMLTDDEVLANNNCSGSISHKGKVVLTGITNQHGSLGEKNTRNLSQGNKKNFRRKDKMFTGGNQLVNTSSYQKVSTNSKGSNHFPRNISKAVEEENVDSANMLRQLHIEVKEFEANFVEHIEIAQDVNQDWGALYGGTLSSWIPCRGAMYRGTLSLWIACKPRGMNGGMRCNRIIQRGAQVLGRKNRVW